MSNEVKNGESSSSPSNTKDIIGGGPHSSTAPTNLDWSSHKQAYVRVKFLLYVEIGENNLQLENHMKRLHGLRKELNYIKNTDWQYDSIDKYIGQA